MENSTNNHALDDIILSLSPIQEKTMFPFDEEDLNGIWKQLSDSDLNWGRMTMLEEEMDIGNSVNPDGYEKYIQDLEKRIEER
jgi:hypothetical protein